MPSYHWQQAERRLSVTGSICQVDEEFHSACEGPPDYEVRNKQYCILHVPDKNKDKGAFGKALK